LISYKPFKVFLAPILALAIVACVSAPSMQADLKVNELAQGRYLISDNYANHRIQQKHYSSSGGKIAYLDYGQGPTLVMLHGVPSSSWMYRKMVSQLQKHFRVIAVDLLGYGSSDKPPLKENNYSAATQALYLKELLRHLEVKQYSLLFHDMGGLVAWEMVSEDLSGDAPAIENLIVLNTIISQTGFAHPKIKKGMMARMISEAYSSKLSSAAILELTFQNMGLSSNAALTEGECRGYVIPMQEGADSALYAFMTSFDEQRFQRLEQQITNLEAFTGDTLVLWGGQDKVLTTEQLPQLQAVLDIRPGNINIFADNAHFIAEEIPSILSDKISVFLKAGEAEQ